MKILAIDTSTELCSAAIYHNGDVIHRAIEAPREHTQRILPMVDELLSESELKLNQFDALAFGQGPGSFTGVRIGIGISQGLAFGSDLPMIGISTLATMAQGVFSREQAQIAYAAIDARMSEIYWAVYHNSEGLAELQGKEWVIRPELLDSKCHLFGEKNEKTQIAVGSGWSAYPELLKPVLGEHAVSESVMFSEAQYMLPLALKKLQAGATVNPELAEPVYLRDTVTWKKLPGR